MDKFHYSNIQKHHRGKNKTIRKVIIQKGRGYKSVSFYKNGKLHKTVKKPLPSDHITMIKKQQFIPGLFADCKPKSKSKSKSNIKSKTRKR